jgi:hypothetical protein
MLVYKGFSEIWSIDDTGPNMPPPMGTEALGSNDPNKIQ